MNEIRRSVAAVTGLVLLGLLLAVGGVATAQNAGGSTTPGATPEKAGNSNGDGTGGNNEQKVLVECEEFVGTTKGKELWELKGNVEMKHKDTVMYCDHAWWDREARTAKLVDKVRVEHPDHLMTSDVCDVNFKDKIAKFTGNVKVRTERKRKEGEKPREDDEMDKYEYMVWSTKCDELTYNYDTDEAVAKGNVESESEDKKYHFYADLANYSKDTLADGTEIEVIHLPSNPLMKSSEGDLYQVTEATVRIWPEDENGDREQRVEAKGVRIVEIRKR